MAKRKQRRDEFQDISSYSSKQAYKKNQKKKKRTGLKVFLSFICVILVLVGGVMIYASTVLLGDLKTTTITKDKTELGISEETKSEAGITNIALFGVDLLHVNDKIVKLVANVFVILANYILSKLVVFRKKK